jgi:hypothetical protein
MILTHRRWLSTLILGLLAMPTMDNHAQADQEPPPILAGAGDIATCSSSADEATATLLDTIQGTVFTAGDNVYPDGTAADFANCYDPSWGRHKARTRPAVGDHEYHVAGATPYFDYFGPAAGVPAKGYYSYNLGAWHVIVLNSNCMEVDCRAGSAQEQWLRADLAAHPTTCAIAISHHPRFSSGRHGSSLKQHPLWQALYEAGVDVVISGHDHNYERFARQNADGLADSKGIRAFVVGTGGAGLRPMGTPIANSVVRNSSTHGVLKMTLYPTSYDWEFVPVSGGTFRDHGTSSCTPSTQEVSNYLRNWSFETDRNPLDGKPDNWSIIPAFSQSNAIPARNGAFVGQIADTGNLNHTVGQTVPNLRPGVSYTLTAWLNIPPQNDPSFLVRLQVRWLASDNTVIQTDTVASYSSETAGWLRARQNIVAPVGTAKARIQIVASRLNGTMYIDQIVFR